MKPIFSEKAWEDYRAWQSIDSKLVSRINGLINGCLRSPFSGIGKPEPSRVALGLVVAADHARA